MIDIVIREAAYETIARQEMLDAVRRNGGLEEARARADQFAEAARGALDELPESEYLDALRAIPTYVLERDR
jgi:geranylgeranyl pyrophosphate synthase